MVSDRRGLLSPFRLSSAAFVGARNIHEQILEASAAHVGVLGVDPLEVLLVGLDGRDYEILVRRVGPPVEMVLSGKVDAKASWLTLASLEHGFRSFVIGTTSAGRVLCFGGALEGLALTEDTSGLKGVACLRAAEVLRANLFDPLRIPASIVDVVLNATRGLLVPQ